MKKFIMSLILFLFLLGLFFILNAQIGITGAVIGAPFNPVRNSAIGFSLIFIASILFFLESSDLERKIEDTQKENPEDSNKAFSIMIKELKGRKPISYKKENNYYYKRAAELTKDNKDTWISQWELEGLEEEFKKEGLYIRGPEGHEGGRLGVPLRHINISGRNEKGEKLKHIHLYITQDPYDSLIKSKVYSPSHPKK